MTPAYIPLTYYCLCILAASLLGGMAPLWFRLTHRGMELFSSFVAGVMLGVGLLDMLPHALLAAEGDPTGAVTPKSIAVATLAGLLAMFFIERFFCFHHHSVDLDEGGDLAAADCHDAGCDRHGPAAPMAHRDMTAFGAALGLTLHSLIGGVALAASVEHRHADQALAGLGTFLVIWLHKPFDSMTIAMLMARGGWSLRWRHAVNGLFALAIPAGVAVFYLGLAGADPSGQTLAYALAFSAGTFLCISLSDLLPELQFHDHDRVQLSLALAAGLAVAYGAGTLEGVLHRH